jgi:hypothetical protein
LIIWSWLVVVVVAIRLMKQQGEAAQEDLELALHLV